MKYQFLIAVVAVVAPLALCQDMVVNPQFQQLQQPYLVGQMQPYSDQLSSSSSQSQAQAQAQAQSQSNSIQDQSNLALLQAPYLNGWQAAAPYPSAPVTAALPGAPAAVPGVQYLSGGCLPGADSPIPAYNPYAAQDAVSESLAETNLAAKIREGSIQVVPPNLSSQAVLQSVHVPVEGQYSNRVFASAPLPPLVVSQPGSPVVQISSGPAAVVRAAPVIYKQRPNIVLQNEVINRHPAPLSLNPVYVKVYKPGKKVLSPRVLPTGPC